MPPLVTSNLYLVKAISVYCPLGKGPNHTKTYHIYLQRAALWRQFTHAITWWYHLPTCLVLRTLRNLDENKLNRPDGIPTLRNYAPVLSPIVTRWYHLSLKSGIVRKSWKLCCAKKGSRPDRAKYTVTSILCRNMDRVLNNRIQAYFEDNERLGDRQYSVFGSLKSTRQGLARKPFKQAFKHMGFLLTFIIGSWTYAEDWL